MTLKAFDNNTGKEVKEGDEVTDFRGEKATFISAERPNMPGKAGKVRIKTGPDLSWTFYASVYNLTVKET